MKIEWREARERLLRHRQDLERRLGALDAAADPPEQLRELAKACGAVDAQLKPLERYRRACEDAEQARALLGDGDAELRALATAELECAEARCAALERELDALSASGEPDAARSAFVEVRAGTGGAEATLFAGDVLRMYLRYAERAGWHTEMVSRRETESKGCREAVVHVVGEGAYGRLRFESGVHRVQRVPETEARGRVHTSACTVAVFAEAALEDELIIDRADLRFSACRASGAGGQHVNKTDSAVRVVHVPSGIAVECQDQRSQHQNRAKALALLRARLLERRERARRSQQDRQRRVLVGSGDRSERIRTYNFPQGRVTDHRIDCTLYRLGEVLDGELDLLIKPLRRAAGSPR